MPVNLSTIRDREHALQLALSDAHPDSYLVVGDLDDEHVYYSIEGERGMLRRSWSEDDEGKITLGDPQRVRPRTEYIPAKRAPAAHLRLASKRPPVSPEIRAACRAIWGSAASDPAAFRAMHREPGSDHREPASMEGFAAPRPAPGAYAERPRVAGGQDFAEIAPWRA